MYAQVNRRGPCSVGQNKVLQMICTTAVNRSREKLCKHFLLRVVTLQLYCFDFKFGQRQSELGLHLRLEGNVLDKVVHEAAFRRKLIMLTSSFNSLHHLHRTCSTCIVCHTFFFLLMVQ